MNDFWQLQKFAWLRASSDEDLQGLAKASAQHEYADRELIFAPTPRPHSVYLLERGLVRIFRLSANGAQATFGFVLPGEAFGEFAAFGEYPRESFAEAVRPSLVHRVPSKAFQDLLSHHPALVVEMARQIGNRFKQIESRVESLVFRSVHARVALILLELAEILGNRTERGIELDISLSQAELATLIGTSRQSVSASLHRLEQQGLIELERLHIVLAEPERLARAVEEEVDG
jgi:CRP/FNR family transcriptional regulator